MQTDKIMANTFQMLGWRLNYINQDVKTTAQNMENMRTPGYKEKELLPFSASLHRTSLALARTHPGHLSILGWERGNFKSRYSFETETDFSGNNVNLQTQLMRANQSGLDHAQMTNLYRAGAQIVEMALPNTK